jgi:hypothetical protein
MSLVELDFNQSTNLFVVPEDTGPQIPRASINRDAFYGEEMASVPVPSIKLEHPDHGPVFAKDVAIRVFATTMQTSVFDSDAEEYANISQHFIRFADKATDWFGGNKCGWMPSKQKEKLKASDPVAYAKASRTKLYRHLFGMIRMNDAVKPGSDPIEFDPIPFRMRLGPSNFYEIGKVVGELEKQKLKHFNYELGIDFKVEKRGSNQWFVLNYKPIVDNKIKVTKDDEANLLTFQQVIQKENEDVTEKMRENIGNGSVGAEFIEPVSDE